METVGQLPARIYHLALRDEWQQSVDSHSVYCRSTLWKSISEVGFVHCAIHEQVQQVADLLYRGRRDVLLLTIDPARVEAEVRLENLDGGRELFPHLYGALPLESVIKVEPVPLGPDGTLAVTSILEENDGRDVGGGDSSERRTPADGQ